MMQSLPEWGVLAGVMALGQMSPGPDMLLLTRTALAEGLKAGLLMAAGIAAGLAVQAAIAVGGVAAIVAAHPIGSGIFTTLAVAYLLWLGWKIMQTAGHIPADQPVRGTDNPGLSAFWRGLACNVLNPQVTLFLAAIVTPFLRQNPGWNWTLLVWATVVIEGGLLWILWAWLLQRGPIRRGHQRVAKWTDRCFALILWALAGAMVMKTLR